MLQQCIYPAGQWSDRPAKVVGWLLICGGSWKTIRTLNSLLSSIQRKDDLPTSKRIDYEFSVDTKDGEDENSLAKIEDLINKFHHHKDTSLRLANQAPETNTYSLPS